MKIVVLCGGLSTERDVSVVSGQNVARALKRNGHKVFLVDVYMGYGDKEEDMRGIFESGRTGLDFDKKYPPMAEKIDELKASRPESADGFFGLNVLSICREADIAFLALHGANGEDGRVQAAFDLLGIKYTGCGHLASAVSMSKIMTRHILMDCGVPMARGFDMTAGGAEKYPEDFGISYPVVVKPAEGGSSVGITIAHGKEEYGKALEAAFALGEGIVVEEYIPGREFSVGVMDGKTLPVIEIAPKQGFYDYKNKYMAGLTDETCPADLPEDIASRMQKYAEEAFAALGLLVYARMDFRLDDKGNMFCLEANTLPGMTPTSLLPQEAAAAGMDFDALVEKIVELSA